MLTHFCSPSYRNLILCSPNWGISLGPQLVFRIEHASFWKISCPCMSVRKHWWFMIQFFKWEHEIIAKNRQWVLVRQVVSLSLSCVCEVKSCQLSDQLSCYEDSQSKVHLLSQLENNAPYTTVSLFAVFPEISCFSYIAHLLVHV